MYRFIGKVAVVTGASSGIGNEISKELVKQGVIVVGLARRVQRLQELSNEISSDKGTYKGKFYYRECDIKDVSQIKSSFEWITSQFKGVSIMINNAGVFRYVSLPAVTVSEYNHVFDTNVKGVLMCSKEAVKSMVDNNLYGHVINISSVAAHQVINVSDNKHMLYTGSKYALRALSRGLRLELATKQANIKVTNISPGVVDTEMLQQSKMKFTGENYILKGSDIAKACIAVLDTAPNCVISELTVQPIHERLI